MIITKCNLFAIIGTEHKARVHSLASAPQFIKSLNMGKLLKLSVSQLPHLQNVGNNRI